MKGIFISYRRQDAAGHAGRLYDRLASHFGAERVFMDVEGIEPGLDFVDAIERAVASCEALIVIIGPGWLATDNARKRRLDDPTDFVRIETAAALARNIRVVPVLVNNAVMPGADELPADLAPLARRQAVELSNKYWDATSAELIRTLERVLDGDKAARGPKASSAASTPPPTPEEAPVLVVRSRDVRRIWMIGGMLALVAAAVGLYLTQPWQEPVEAVPNAEHAPVSPPAKTIAAGPAENTAPAEQKPPAPPAEKAAPLASEKPPLPPAEKAAPPASEKPPVPPAEKAAPRPSEKPAAPSVAKTPAAAPARGPEKPAVPEPSQAAKPSSVPPPARSSATTSAAPPVRGAETASAPAPPDEKVATATPARPVDKPSAPVAAEAAITPPVIASVAPPSALPATLPRVGDTWEYRWRSKWPTIEPRTYAHRVTAVSAREVAETMSVVTSPDSVAVSQAFTPDTRFVEWRGRFYLLEFNPFLGAFGGLQDPAAISKLPAMPAENPLQAGWYGRARIRGSESVTVPAGTFKSLKVEIDSNRAPTEGLGMRSSEPVRALLTLWYAPEVKRTVKMVRIVLTEEGMHLDEDTYELMRYRVQ